MADDAARSRLGRGLASLIGDVGAESQSHERVSRSQRKVPIEHVRANPRNPHSSGPALRALIAALEQWVTKGVAPPESRVPSIAQKTARDASDIKMPMVKGFALAPGANPIGPPVDWVDPPARLDNFYGTAVCAVDADGNEIAGVRLPSIAVPLGTYTGWNVYRAQPCELCDRDGSFIPFASTKREREAADDPRLPGLHLIPKHFRAGRDVEALLGGEALRLVRGERLAMNHSYKYDADAFVRGHLPAVARMGLADVDHQKLACSLCRWYTASTSG